MTEQLDPRRQMMIAALYEELSADEQREFRALLAEDATLRAEWQELQETRYFLERAEAESAAPDFSFELPAAVAQAGSGPLGLLKLRPRWRSPALAFAAAAALFLILLLAGLRVDRVEGGFALRFGSPSPSTAPAENHRVAAAGDPRARDANTALAMSRGEVQADDYDLNEFVTRGELAAFAEQMIHATDAMLVDYEDRRLGQTAYLIRDYTRSLNEQRRRDQGMMNDRLDEVWMGLAGLDAARAVPGAENGDFRAQPINR